MNKPTCPAGAPKCAPETIQHDLVAERTTMAIRNIMSGQNDCGVLINKDGTVNPEHLDRSIRPVIRVIESEKDMLRADRARVSAESEERRQALELVYSNALGQLSPDVAARVCHVLGFAANARNN